MTYSMKPLGCDPARIKDMSERLTVSHYKQLRRRREASQPDRRASCGAGLRQGAGLRSQRSQARAMIAMNSMILHELFFDGLGDQREPLADPRAALARDFGSYDRWRSEFVAIGKALGGNP